MEGEQKNGAELEFLVTLKGGEGVGRTVDEARWVMAEADQEKLAEYLSGLE